MGKSLRQPWQHCESYTGGLLRDPSAWTLQTLLGKYAASFLELIKLPRKRERERERERREKEASGGTEGRMRDSTSGSTFFAYCQGLSTRQPETELIGDTSSCSFKGDVPRILNLKRRRITTPRCIDVCLRESPSREKREGSRQLCRLASRQRHRVSILLIFRIRGQSRPGAAERARSSYSRTMQAISRERSMRELIIRILCRRL